MAPPKPMGRQTSSLLLAVIAAVVCDTPPGAAPAGSHARRRAPAALCPPSADASARLEAENAPDKSQFKRAIQAPSLNGTFVRGHYAAVVDVSQHTVSHRVACTDALFRTRADDGPADPPDALGAIAEAAGVRALALAFTARFSGGGDFHPPWRYGHVWSYVHGFYCRLAVPRARALEARRVAARPPPPPLRLYLPAGVAAHPHAFEEIGALFNDSRALGLEIRRASWVPFCVRACCYAHAGVPRALRGRVALLRSLVPGPDRMAPRACARMRADALRALGAAEGPRDQVLFLSSASSTNRRRFADERALVRAARAWARALSPHLTFQKVKLSSLRSYAEEARLFARARVVIGLFSSSLHGCRFMRPPALVVELHGALYNNARNHFLYYSLCGLQYGLLHAPLAVPGALPVADASTGELRFEADAGNVANLSAAELRAFLERVLPAEPSAIVDWEGVLGAYEAVFAAHPDPRVRGGSGGRRPPGDGPAASAHYRAASKLPAWQVLGLHDRRHR